MTFDFPIIALQEVDSTSRYLTSLCDEKRDEVEPFTTVLAEFQSAGKGQRGNSWESEVGANLTFSFVLYPDFLPAKKQFVISQVISLGILHVFYLQGMNLGRCVCGIGLNVNQAQFLSDAPNPVSLSQVIGRKIDREKLLMEVMTEIKALYSQLSQQGNEAIEALSSSYFQHLYRAEGYHRYQDQAGEFMARLVRVESDGRLVLEDESQCERSYLFKEVQYLI